MVSITGSNPVLITIFNIMGEEEEEYDYLNGFIEQFGDGELGELNPNDWTALEFLLWLEINNFKLIKNKLWKKKNQKMFNQ